MLYEKKSKPLLAPKKFRRRLYSHILIACLLVVFTLTLGVAGHMHFDQMRFSTALVASITLTSGLGLSVLPESSGGQVFAGFYGFFSGYVHIATSSIIMAPIVHRVLHKFHLEK